MVDIRLSFVQRQRTKPAEGGDALHQLLLFGQRQALRQLRLSGQDNLHELGGRGFEIGELPQRFQYGKVQVLRFIQYHDYALALSRRPGEHLVELLRQFANRGLFGSCSQLVQHRLQQFAGVGLRLKQEGSMSAGAKSLEKIEQQCGLAHAGLRHQYLEPEITVNPVDQRGQGFPMGVAGEQETRVRGHPERVLPQPEMAQELTLHRGFRRVAAQCAPIRQSLLQVERHPPKAAMGADFKGYGEDQSTAVPAMRKNLQ